MFTRLISRLANAIEPANPRRKWNIFLLRGFFAVPLLLLALLSYFTIADNLTRLLIEQKESESVRIAHTLEERVVRIFDVGREFSMHPQIRAAILKGDNEETLEYLELMKRMMNEPFIDNVFIAEPDGTLAVVYPKSGTEGRNYSHRDWYRGVMDSGKPYLSEAYRRASEPQYNVVVVAIPIADERNQLAAILGFQVRLDHFFELTQSIDVGKEAVITVVDQRGHAVSHPLAPMQGDIADLSQEPVVAKLLRGERGVEVFGKFAERDRSIIAYEPISRFGWGVIIKEPTANAFASRDRVLVILAMLFALVFILNTFFTYLIYRIISRYQMRCPEVLPKE